MAKPLIYVAHKIPRVQMAIFLSVISLLCLAWLGVKLVQAHIYHQHLTARTLHTSTLLGSHQTPQALFANAFKLAQQGQTEKSLAAYAMVTAKSNDEYLRQSAYFNSGNVYLTQATNRLEKEGLPGWDVAGPLVALAKESYQKALRLQPNWSEAKYNYHLALRLAPTTHGMQGPQQYEDDQIKQEEKPSGWPAMPGNPRGMP